MGELSYSAGARVAGTTTSERGPAVSCKAGRPMPSTPAPAPAPAVVPCAKRSTEQGILSCLCHNNLKPGCSQMLIYCRKDEYAVVSPHYGIPYTVQRHHLP